MQMKKRRFKWKNILILLFIIFCLTFLILSIKDVINWKLDSKKIEQQVEKIEDIVIVEEVTESENTEIIKQTDEISETDPYWDYINQSLINVNFEELKKINSNTKGWLQVNGTNINYPLFK